MVINKKLLRSGKSNNLRFIGSALIISICVCMYVSFMSMGWSLMNEVEKYRTEYNLHDYILSVSNEISNEEALAEKYNIDLESRFYSEIEGSDGDIIRLMSANEAVDKYAVTKGKDIGSEDDILLDELYAEKNGFTIGSEITLGGKIFSISGYFSEPDFTLITNSTKNIAINHSSYGIAVADKETVSAFPQSAVEYLIKCKDESFDREEFLKDVYASAMIEQLIAKESDNRTSYIDGDILIYTKGMQIIPFFFMIAASFAAAVILSKLMNAETVQIGIFYSFGYKLSDLYRHYIFYPLIISAAGGVTGIISGIFTAPVLIEIVTERYCVPPFETSLNTKTVLTALLAPIILLVGICSIFIINKLKQSPLTLLRNQTSEKSGHIFRGLKLQKLSFSSRFRVREILRNFPKYLFMMFGVSLSAVMLLLFASVLGSLNKMMDDSFSKIFCYEYMYTFSEMQVGTPDGYRTNLSYLMLNGEEISVNGVDVNNAHMQFEDTNGNNVSFEDNVITINLAQKHNIKAGDTVTLKNRYTDDEYEIKIDRIAFSYAEDFISMPLDEYNDFFGYPENSYIIVTTDSEIKVNKDELLSVNSMKNNRESIDETLNPVRFIMIAMMVMAAIVSFVLMTIIISIILEDSRFTVSMLKIFGYDEKRISKMLIDFNRFIVILAFVASIPLTLSAASVIMEYLSEMIGMYIPPYLDPVHASMGFLLLYVIFILVKIMMRKKILSIDPAETLKSTE